MNAAKSPQPPFSHADGPVAIKFGELPVANRVGYSGSVTSLSVQSDDGVPSISN